MRNRREVLSRGKLAAQETAHFRPTANYPLWSITGRCCRLMSEQRSWINPPVGSIDSDRWEETLSSKDSLEVDENVRQLIRPEIYSAKTYDEVP